MKNLIYLFAGILISGCQEKQTTVTSYSLEQFEKNFQVGEGSFSPDGSKILYSTDKTGVIKVFSFDLSSEEDSQLTHSTEKSDFAISYLSDNKRFIYRADGGGNENFSIYLTTHSGEEKNLTPETNSRNEFLGWNESKTQIIFASSKRTGRGMDVYTMEISSMEDSLPSSELI